MKRIFKILKTLIISKYQFTIPKNIEILIFGNKRLDECENIFKKRKFLVIESDFFSTRTFYLTPKLLINSIKFNRGNLYKSYVLSLISLIKPKIAFTFTDNSFLFSYLTKRLKDKIHFIAVQNGSRYQIYEHKEMFKKKITKVDLNKNFFFSNYLSFGKIEQDDFKKHKIKVKNILQTGNLKLDNFIRRNKNRKFKKVNDICFLSDFESWEEKLGKKKLELAFAQLIKYCIRFKKKHRISMKFVYKKKTYLIENNPPYLREKNFYKNYLNENEFKILQNSIVERKNKFTTYNLIAKSKVVIATMTTMLREAHMLKSKFLACNLSDINAYDFPIKGIFTLNRCSYESFEKRLIKILKINNSKYLKLTKKSNKYLINYDSNYPTIEIIKNFINQKLNEETLKNL